MEKNVTDKLIEIRKSKGFKTRDMLMRSIEKYCKENNEQKFGDKTLQRMEKNQTASEKTISIVAAVLNIEPNLLKKNSDVNYSEIIPDEAYSEIQLVKLDTIKNKYFQNNFSKTEKRKFIMDIASCDDYNQKQVIKKFVKLIDEYSEKKTDILKKIESDNFGSLEEVNSNLTLEEELESITVAFNSGIQFYQIEHLGEFYPQPQKDRIKPLYIYYGMHPYATYWPVPIDFYRTKLNETVGGGFSKYFPNKRLHDPKTGYDYFPDKINDFVLAPLQMIYSFFVISTHPNLKKITYNNQVSKIIVEDWNTIAKNLDQNTLRDSLDDDNSKKYFKNIETKILGKKFKGLFDNIIRDIYHGIDGLPKNFLEDSDFNIIYGSDKKKDEVPSDPDDFLAWAKRKQAICYSTILNFPSFYSYVKHLGNEKHFKTEDNLSFKSRNKWIEDRKLKDCLMADIDQLLPHFDYDVHKVIDVVHEGGKKFEDALEKSKLLTEEDIP